MRNQGIEELESTKKQNPAFQNSKIILPHLTFSYGELTLKVGKKNLIIFLTPGHTEDGISVFVEEDRVLFAGDAFLPVPQLTDGRYKDTLAFMKKIGSMGLENIIQGHGDIILRGEIDAAVKENTNYLNNIKKAVKSGGKRKNIEEYLEEITIESCGKSRVYLGGLAETLHRRNLRALHRQMNSE